MDIVLYALPNLFPCKCVTCSILLWTNKLALFHTLYVTI